VSSALRAAVATEVRLSAVEMDACWEMLRLGDTPLTLTLPSPGRSYAERDQILAEVLTQLQYRGLGTRSGPNDLVARPLRLLARPDYQVDLRLGGDPYGEIIGIGAVAGEQAVVVFRRDELIRIMPVRPAQVVAALLGVVGQIRPGAGRPVNIPADIYDDARRATTDNNLWTMADELVARDVPRLDASSWVRMCTGVRAFGQLGSAFWPEGVQRFGPWVIGFHRAESGHFLQLRRPGVAGGCTVTVCPVEASRLYHLVTELLAAGH
jgi:EspG family